MSEHCAHAYHKPGDVSLHCRILEKKDEKRDWCAHQFLCKRTRQWEVSDGAIQCEIRRQGQK